MWRSLLSGRRPIVNAVYKGRWGAASWQMSAPSSAAQLFGTYVVCDEWESLAYRCPALALLNKRQRYRRCVQMQPGSSTRLVRGGWTLLPSLAPRSFPFCLLQIHIPCGACHKCTEPRPSKQALHRGNLFSHSPAYVAFRFLHWFVR